MQFKHVHKILVGNKENLLKYIPVFKYNVKITYSIENSS